MQIIVMSSDNQYHCLRGFDYLFNKYLSKQAAMICGFSPLPFKLRPWCNFFSIGDFSHYPVNRWSDALMVVLDSIAEDVFLLLFDDFWPIRPADIRAIEMIYDYMHQFQNVIKFDLTNERLFADGGTHYLWGYNTYDTLGYLDLIKSKPGSPYHLSLWGGMWRRDLLKEVLIPGETAQQIELNGTHRLAQYGDDMLVLGTRQAPLMHANVIQQGRWNQDATVGLPALKVSDREELVKLGYIE